MYPLASPFQFPGKSPSRRSVVLARGGMVATSQPLAAYVGAKVIDAGGNAVDAAVATALALVVTEPRSTHLGGDAFAIVANDNKVEAINGSGKSPEKLTPDLIRGQGHARVPKEGPLSVTVPGFLHALNELVTTHGTMGFDSLLSHSIGYAEDGFPLTQEISSRWSAQEAKLKKYGADDNAYLPGGRAPRPGEIFRNPAMARTLRILMEDGPLSFYQGRLAEEIANESAALGCLLSQADLEQHSSEWVPTISTKFGDLHVHEIPPNGQGLIALLGLGILNRLDRSDSEVERIHLEIEAVKLAFEQGVPRIADRDFYDFDDDILSDSSLSRLAGELDPRRAIERSSLMPPGKDTVYIAAADSSGQLVSLITSIFDGFGSGVVLPSSGIVMQNRASGFSMSERSPNRLEPGKRPYHTIIPGLATKDGAPLLSFGVMGGLMQPQGHVQVLSRFVHEGYDIQEALDAPRFRVGDDGSVLLEQQHSALIPGLEKLGHSVKVSLDSGDFGGGQMVGAWDGVLCGASDPRKDGMAVGL